MKLFYILFFVLVSLLTIIILAAITPEISGATGVPHPEFKGMMISPTNIDEQSNTRWLGYLFGIGIICLFGIMLFIGNRRQGRITSMGKWLGIGIIVYLIVYSCMVISHWEYSHEQGGNFVLAMPIPTAWMIFAVWFVPLIITIAYVVKFEDAIISDEEIRDFHNYLDLNKEKES